MSIRSLFSSIISGACLSQNNVSLTGASAANEAVLSGAKTAALVGLALFGTACSNYEGPDTTTLLSITGGSMGVATIFYLARRWRQSAPKPGVTTNENGRGISQGQSAALSKILEFNPNDPSAYYARGLDKEKSGDLPGAIEDFTRAIELEPKSARYWMRRGAIKHEKGDHQGAIDEHTQAITIDENYANAYYHRAVAHRALGRVSEALEDLRETKKRGGHGGIGYFAHRDMQVLEKTMSAPPHEALEQAES